MDTLILAVPVDTGYHFELRNVRGGFRSVLIPEIRNWDENTMEKSLQETKLFACNGADVPAIVEEVSKHNVGTRIGIYTLTGQYHRLPGELKNLTVTKDGKLPF